VFAVSSRTYYMNILLKDGVPTVDFLNVFPQSLQANAEKLL
jgi:hypothetical protein